MTTKKFSTPILLAVLFCFLLWLSQAIDTLKPGDDLRDAKTLVSSNGVFELGFFGSSGADSSNFYLGIWFKNDPNKKAVWVANRENPILDSSGVLTVRYDGNLVITDRRQIPIIVNSGMLAVSSNTSATLLDSGNLVLQEGDGNHSVWESFYYPSDTFLPGMRIGLFYLGTDHWRKQFLVSWQSPSFPASGSFVFCLDTDNKTYLKVWYRNGVSREVGFWDGQRFRFFFARLSDDYDFRYVLNPNEAYLTFSTKTNSSYSWFVMASSGEIQEYKMTGKVISAVSLPVCGNSTASNGTDCYTKMQPICKDGDNFLQTKGSMPNLITIIESVHLGTSDCEIMCRGNCSCAAFASFHDDGTGCEFYYGDRNLLLDVIGEGNGTIYIRGDIPSKFAKTPTKTDPQKKRRLWLILVIPIASLVLLVIVSLITYLGWINHCCTGWKGKQDSIGGSTELFLFQLGTHEVSSRDETGFGRKKDHELPQLSFSCITTATDNFSAGNKLGEGGFGPVYKGVLVGHEIAVKRLSSRSGQGIEEFKNEVQLISKLQHRNLVRLLGCCIQREENILVYEYMANRSLDSFIFDPTKQKLLDWEKRVSIIEGIAQGLLYLHKFSRLRIIHRDLKTSNILLDDHMNPKISDFGMARIFGEDEVRAKTTRVVGTYGYMSPEYAVHGIFSIKSDVFSFGVIMLEIISGRRNTSFSPSDPSFYLLGHAWELWKEGQGLELMDPTLANSCSRSELMLCIQVALLCVQESPAERPTMSDIIYMLSNENINLPVPKQPAFSTSVSYSGSPGPQACSLNEITVSMIQPR